MQDRGKRPQVISTRVCLGEPKLRSTTHRERTGDFHRVHRHYRLHQQRPSRPVFGPGDRPRAPSPTGPSVSSGASTLLLRLNKEKVVRQLGVGSFTHSGRTHTSPVSPVGPTQPTRTHRARTDEKGRKGSSVTLGPFGDAPDDQ